MTSIEEIQLNLVKGAAAAKKSGDYLAYATVIDLNVGNFDDFTSEDAAVVLDTLATTLDQPEYECLVYSIGWDIPELMMWYVDHFHEDNDSAFLTAMSKLGNVLCQKANPKELFLKSCELMEMLDLSVEGAEEEEHDEAAADAKEFSANSRFCLLFEMMRFSLNRIETAYPTRFVKTANSVLLAVADAKTDITGVTVVLRRIFVFARDFGMDMTQASQEEKQATKRLLVSLLTYGADISLQRFNVKWSERLYYQLVNKVATLQDPNARGCSYQLSLYTARLENALTRCAQLALSYDMDPKEVLHEYIITENPNAIRSYASRPKDDMNATLDYLLTPSIVGMFFLYTQLFFYGTPHRVHLDKVVIKAIYFKKHCPLTFGVRDAFLYWTLWACATIDKHEVDCIPPEKFKEFSGMLIAIAGTSPVCKERCIAYTLSNKILRYSDPELALDVLLETIRTSQYDHVLDACVQILKTIVLGTKKGPDAYCGNQARNTDFGSDIEKLNINPKFVLSDARKQQIAEIAEGAVDDICEGRKNLSPYILSWLNFLTVVDVDKSTVARIKAKLNKYLVNHPEDNNTNLVRLALDNMSRCRVQCSISRIFGIK